MANNRIGGITPGNCAVITGGASGIGLAAAHRFAERGMNLVIADRSQEQLNGAVEELSASCPPAVEILPFVCDVSSQEQVQALAEFTKESLGDVSVLMNNAGVGNNPGKPWENPQGWQQLIDINLWGVINAVQAFVPDMIAHGKEGLVIHTGSKQGLTRPPGNPAYNLSKAGVIAFTESLAHEFRQLPNNALSAHLLIPGFTYTGMMKKVLPQKPPSAWTPDQVADLMLESLARGDFYILCPDNEVTREMDERRIQWNADDIIHNRPALSRWHEEYTEAFEAFMSR